MNLHKMKVRVRKIFFRVRTAPHYTNKLFFRTAPHRTGCGRCARVRRCGNDDLQYSPIYAGGGFAVSINNFFLLLFSSGRCKCIAYFFDYGNFRNPIMSSNSATQWVVFRQVLENLNISLCAYIDNCMEAKILEFFHCPFSYLFMGFQLVLNEKERQSQDTVTN